MKNYDRKFIAYTESIFYYLDNKLHRLDGPAYIPSSNVSCTKKEWYIHGVQVNVSSQKEFKRYLKLITFW